MISREELIKSPEYWFERAKIELYGQVVDYMEKEGINQNQLAERLGVSKGYVSQILRGNFNHTLRKLIELGLAVGKVPVVTYRSVETILRSEGVPNRASPRRRTAKRSKRRKMKSNTTSKA